MKKVKFLFTILILTLSLFSVSVFAETINEELWLDKEVESSLIEYSIKWNTAEDGTKFAIASETWVEFDFEGTAIRIYGNKAPNTGKMDIYLDGELVEEVDTYSEEKKNDVVLFEIDNLKPDKHTLKMDVLGEGNNAPFIQFTGFSFIPTLESEIKSTREIVDNAIVGKPDIARKTVEYYPPEIFKTTEVILKNAETVAKFKDSLSDTISIEDYILKVRRARERLLDAAKTYIPESRPFPRTIPRKIGAENYDMGGQDVAYYDTSGGNTGGDYRNEDVDIEMSDPGYIVGWTEDSEWLNYTVYVEKAGEYSVTLVTSTPNDDRKMTVRVNEEDQLTLDIPSTGEWHDYTSTTEESIELEEGKQVITIYFETGGINFASFELEPLE